MYIKIFIEEETHDYNEFILSVNFACIIFQMAERIFPRIMIIIGRNAKCSRSNNNVAK